MMFFKLWRRTDLANCRDDPSAVTPTWGWAIFCGDAPGLARKATELLQEQSKLLETANVLSRTELESYERRSEQIGELIRLLAKE